MQIKIKTTDMPKMDLNARANNEDFVKNLIFGKKEIAILKLLELINSVVSINSNAKIIYMKTIPVLFGFAELNEICISECLAIIAKIKRHPSFIQERSLFDGWNSRLKNLLTGRESTINIVRNEPKSTENKFVSIPGTDLYDVIGYSELDLFLRFNKWLKYHKLHKYLYFFSNLSYLEIVNINEKNIRQFESKVGLHPMTDGARNAILRKLAELRQRSARLEILGKNMVKKGNLFLGCREDTSTCHYNKDYYTSVSKIEKSIYEIKSILKTPVRRNQLLNNDNLPVLLKNAIETVIFVILRLPRAELSMLYEKSVALLKMAWGCSFFENDIKKKFNVLQAALHSKNRSYSKRKVISSSTKHSNRKDVCAHQFDIESGIRAVTWYLENVVLKDI